MFSRELFPSRVLALQKRLQNPWLLKEGLELHRAQLDLALARKAKERGENNQTTLALSLYYQ